MAKKQNKITGSILGLIFLIPKLFGLVGDVGRLIKDEAHHGARNIAIIIFLSFICAMLFTTTWVCLLTMLFFYLSSKLSVMVALAIILLVNVLFMIIVALVILNLKKNIFFPATLKHLSKVRSKLS